jgi:hypothetical protein
MKCVCFIFNVYSCAEWRAWLFFAGRFAGNFVGWIGSAMPCYALADISGRRQVCVCVCVCVCMYMYMCTHVSLWHTRILEIPCYALADISGSRQVYVCVYVFIFIFMAQQCHATLSRMHHAINRYTLPYYFGARVCAAYISTYIHTHTYTHTCMHAYILQSMQTEHANKRCVVCTTADTNQQA